MRTNGWGWRFAWALGAILPLLLTGRPGISLAAVNVHDIHVPGGAASRPCADCHTGSAHNSATTFGGGNGTVEVPTAALTSINFLYMDGTLDTGSRGVYNNAGVCTNVDCHGGNATSDLDIITTAERCGSCHFGTAADVDNFTTDRILAHVNSSQWGESGHGATANYSVSGSTGANFAGPASDPKGCAYCHDLSVDHGDAANPFRLKVQTGGWNGTCLVCHATNDAGYQPPGGYTARGSGNGSGKPADAAHYGSAHGGTEGGKFCWDCHDPHGDRSSSSGNVYMVHSSVSKTSDSTYGVPSSTAAVTFTRKTIGSLGTPGYYVETANNAATGICQACHTDASGFTGEVKYWRSNLSEDVDANGTSELTPVTRHNEDAVCTSCHQHDNQFGAGCTDCHGNNTSGERWPDSDAGNNPNRSAYADDEGAHVEHITAIYNANSGTLPGSTATDKKNNTCGWCHPGNPPPGHPTDATTGANLAELTRMDKLGDGFQTTPRGADDYWYFAGGATATSGTPVYYKTLGGANDSETAYYRFTDNRCLNTACHSQPSPAWYGGADTTPPTVSNARVNGSVNLSVQKGTATVTLTADASDSNIVVAGEYFVGTEGTAGAGMAMGASDGVFDEQNETLTAVVNSSGWDTGTQTIYVDAKDAANNWGPTTAATVQVTVTAQDSFVLTNTPGSTGNANTGATNVLMQTVTVSVTSGSVDLTALEVKGTRGSGTGDVAVDVAQVKIYKDNGGAGVFDPGADTLISGTGLFLNSSTKKVAVDIADQLGVSGTFYLYIVFDISTGATANDVIGAQLTALTYGATDNLATALPLPADGSEQNVKTIVVAGDTAPPVVGTLQVWSAGVTVTSIQEETTTVTLTAVANDTSTGGNVIAAAEYFVGSAGTAGTGTGLLAADGAFDEVSENLTSNTGASPPQVDTTLWTAAGSPYTIYVDAKDGAGNWSSAASVTITVTPKDVVTVTGQQP